MWSAFALFLAIIQSPQHMAYTYIMQHLLVVFILLCLATPAIGQFTQPDSSFVQSAQDEAINSYEQTLHEQAHVYEGNEYLAHDHRIKIHPYYKIDTLQKGTITYNGVLYQDVPMLYDIVREELAVQPPGGGYRIRLRNDYVSDFALGSHQFSRLGSDSSSTAGIPVGYYEILNEGRVKALAHRIKTVYEDISSGKYQAEYLLKDRFYIQKGGVYYEVRNKRSMLSLFPEQAKALRKYIRVNKLKFKDDQREEAVSRITKRYEELTQ